MAQNGYGAPGQQLGRIPNYGKNQVNPMGNVEPPACIQNAMMTKDKKPFTYTPGGLDLSQIKTPSMARRMARQRSQEEHEQAYAQQQHPNGGANHHLQGNYHPQGGPAPPPPPPMNIPAPPPPPPLVIQTPASKSPKPNTLAPGERPEIVIPENPIGMLRKTNSPYHWEAEKAENQRMGAVPKFVEKVPSPLTVKMPPSSFSQQPPQNFMPQSNNNHHQNYPYSNANPESPLHKPEAQYANHNYSPVGATPPSPPTREFLQRQDSQFNKSPLPYLGQPPVSNGSPFSPSPNSSWRQPEKRDSPASSAVSPQSPLNRGQFSPNTQNYSPQSQMSPHTGSPIFNTLPRAASRVQDEYANNNQGNNRVMYNNVNQARPQSPRLDTSNAAPWRTNTLNRQSKEAENIPSLYHNSQPHNQQATYTPPWLKSQEVNNNQTQQSSPWNNDNGNAQNHSSQDNSPPWTSHDSNNNKSQNDYTPPWRSANEVKSPQNQPQEQPRYQSSISIPVTARKPQREPGHASTPPQKEIVYVNQEPVYFCPESPKDMPGFVKAQKEKTKTPPPIWCQRPLEGGRKSVPRELVTPPRDVNQEPEWVKLSNEMQRGVREVVSPPRYQQPQPTWSTRPSDNRKSLPKDNPPNGSRVIPVQMEVSSTETRDYGRQGHPNQLRITIGMQPNPNYQGQGSGSPQGPYSQPTQRIMRVLSPQLVRMDEGPSAQKELPTLNRNFQNNQVKERIIPIQIEGGNDGANKRIIYHKFTQEAPPRQSKSFRVLQIITGTEDQVDLQGMESQHGYSDL